MKSTYIIPFMISSYITITLIIIPSLICVLERDVITSKLEEERGHWMAVSREKGVLENIELGLIHPLYAQLSLP